MVIESQKKLECYVIDTGNLDPIMVLGLMRAKVHEMYEIIIEGNRVIVHRMPCNP